METNSSTPPPPPPLQSVALPLPSREAHSLTHASAAPQNSSTDCTPVPSSPDVSSTSHVTQSPSSTSRSVTHAPQLEHSASRSTPVAEHDDSASGSGQRQPHSALRSAPQVSVFDNTKAGLQSVDKEKTEALIKELSKNSSYYQNEERKAANRQKHIDALLEKTRYYEASVRGRPDVFRKLQREVADLEATIESHREFDHIYVHLDMDMFYAAVEMKKNPRFRTLPLGIGGIGMLSTTNYIARQYGVRSGMPGFIGLKLCPELVIVPTDFAACQVESQKFKAVVRSYDPSAHGLGMDEIMMCLNSYLAVHCMSATTHAERFDAAERIVEECRRRVHEETELTASAGIAPTPTLAKMASNYKKPNGQSSVRLFTREAVMDFLSPIAVRQVPGIGKSQESILAGLGIHTLGDIYAERHRLYYILTRKTYEFLLCSAMGVGGMYDSQEVTTSSSAVDGSAEDGEGEEEDWWRKSVGQERTFSQLLNRSDLQSIAYRNLHKSHSILVKERLLTSQIVLKLKYRTFHVKQHGKSLNVYTDDLDVLQRALDEVLLPVLDQFAEFRLLGVRLEKLKQRGDGDGVGGATSLPKTTSNSNNNNGDAQEAGQKTLSDFFKKQLAAAEERRAALQSRKRFRRDEGTGKENAESDVEVLVVSSESQLDVGEEEEEGEDLEEVKEQEMTNGPEIVRTLNHTPAPLKMNETEKNVNVVDSEEEHSSGDDGGGDDDVIFVE